jgi:hypothetical protein
VQSNISFFSFIDKDTALLQHAKIRHPNRTNTHTRDDRKPEREEDERGMAHQDSHQVSLFKDIYSKPMESTKMEERKKRESQTMIR